MNNRTSKLVSTLLTATREKFSGNFSDVPKVLIFWHNLLYIVFSSINYRRLFKASDLGIDKMMALKLMPEYLYNFYYNNKDILDKYIHDSVTEFFALPNNVNDYRQQLLNVELDFTNNKLEFFSDKVSRDNIGSYYTPEELSREIIKKVFSDKSFETRKNYKIADFSCGGGDFFLSIIDYMKKQHGIDSKITVKWFYGVDLDPISLQNCIVNLLLYADRDDWDVIISHFTFANPLIVSTNIIDDEGKNNLFATRRLYSVGLGLPQSFFEDTYDVVVGNPPWEKIRFEERKFFRGIVNEIAVASQKNIRDEKVKKLKESWPIIYDWRNNVYNEYSQITSTKYRHCKISDAISGELNTYSLFTELAYNMLSHKGFLALIIKSTLVTAPAHKKLWTKFLVDKSVRRVYLFENKNKIFNIDGRERFIVFEAAKTTNNSFEFITGLTDPKMINNAKAITLTLKDLSKINPFTNTIPNVGNNEEISFLAEAHNRFKCFSDVYPKCHFGRLIHLTAHAAWIDKNKSADNVPIYEGKFIEQYDARYATFRGISDSEKYANKASAVKTSLMKDGKKELPECRYFVRKELWNKYLDQYNEKYSLCWRSLTSPTNRRTMLAMILPTCPTCQSIQMLQTEKNEDLVLLLALFNSIPFDYFVRIKMPGLDLTQSVIKQIPVPSNEEYDEIISLNGINCSLRKHILSYVVSIIRGEERLSGLIEKLDIDTYEIEASVHEKQKMIDFLFKKAYHLDDTTYAKILATFPKYQASRTVWR